MNGLKDQHSWKLPPERRPNCFEKKSAKNEEIFQTFNVPDKCDVSLFASIVKCGDMDRLIGYFSLSFEGGCSLLVVCESLFV